MQCHRLPSSSGRSPLFAAISRTLRLAAMAARPGMPPVPDFIEAVRAARLSRRAMLRAAAGAGSLAWLQQSTARAGHPAPVRSTQHKPPAQGARPAPARPARRQPRIAIIGAGLAGLNAAYTLKKLGLFATVFTGPDRLGGRVATARDLMAPGLTTELGGEFIDSGHADMLGLAQEFGLSLIDTHSPGESMLAGTFVVKGVRYSEANLIASVMPIAARIAADAARVGAPTAFAHNRAAVRLDQLSIDAYLDSLHVVDPIRTLLRVAYRGEFGTATDVQSALNLILLLSSGAGMGPSLYGASDTRYKIAGGNHLVVDALADQLRDRIAPGNRLVAVRKLPDFTYKLSFATVGGPTREVVADFVLLAIPFTILREIELQVPMPSPKRRAIDFLGYGKSAKLLVGTTSRFWRSQGYTGNAVSDAGYELWDNSRLQPGTSGGLTFFLGDDQAAHLGDGTVSDRLAQYLPSGDTIFPGLAGSLNGNLGRAVWPDDPWVQAGYSAYRVGQVTSLAGYEILPVGNLFFAGEHCSYTSQGYMNGAAETGRIAARHLAAQAVAS